MSRTRLHATPTRSADALNLRDLGSFDAFVTVIALALLAAVPAASPAETSYGSCLRFELVAMDGRVIERLPISQRDVTVIGHMTEEPRHWGGDDFAPVHRIDLRYSSSAARTLAHATAKHLEDRGMIQLRISRDGYGSVDAMVQNALSGDQGTLTVDGSQPVEHWIALFEKPCELTTA